MKTLVRIFFTILLLSTLNIGHATDTSRSLIRNTSCDENGNCNLQLSSAKIGPVSCPSSYLHWDGNTIAGKSMHTIALSALLAEKKVIIGFDSTNCYQLIGRSLLRPGVTAITIIR